MIDDVRNWQCWNETEECVNEIVFVCCTQMHYGVNGYTVSGTLHMKKIHFDVIFVFVGSLAG